MERTDGFSSLGSPEQSEGMAQTIHDDRSPWSSQLKYITALQLAALQRELQIQRKLRIRCK